MDLKSKYFGLANELMEYLVRGDGTYLVDETSTSHRVMSVTVKLARDDKSNIIMTKRNNEPVQFFVDVNFLLSDESRGTMQVCLAPTFIMLVFQKRVKLEENDVPEEKVKEIADGLVNGSDQPDFNEENTILWSKYLINYISNGSGIHSPSLVDSLLGMTKVKVEWAHSDEVNKLLNFSDGEALIYQCQIVYETEADTNTVGSIVFQVMPFDIHFSS